MILGARESRYTYALSPSIRSFNRVELKQLRCWSDLWWLFHVLLRKVFERYLTLLSFPLIPFSSIFLLWGKLEGGWLSRFSAPRKLPSKRRDRKEHIFLLETRLIGSFGLLENNVTSKYPSHICAESNRWLHFTVHSLTDKVTKAMFSQSWNFYYNTNWW